MQTLKAKIKKSMCRRRSGSETIEMVANTALMIIFIAVLLLVLTYVVECAVVNFATNRCCRTVETSGRVNEAELQQLFTKSLGTTEFLPKEKRKLTINYNAGRIGGGRIQLKDSFEVIGDAVYRVHLIKPGYAEGFYIDMPIRVTVHGMSEVYFITS